MNTLYGMCGGFLLATTFFNTLLRAFRFSHEAGLSRLAETSPRFQKSATRWEKRWHEMTGLVTLLAGTSQILTIGAAFLIHDRLFGDLSLPGIALLCAYGLVNILMTRSLPWELAEHYADRVTLLGLPLTAALFWALFPLAYIIWFLERTLHLRLANTQETGNRPSAGDEILTLVEQTKDHELDDDERAFIRSALEFGETITREIMTPRVRMFGLEDTVTVEEAVEQIKDSPYSRFPLFHDDYDEVLGMIHVKDLIQAIAAGKMNHPVKSLMAPATFVPESMPIGDLLRLMKQKKVHTAISVDEYGGTAGVVTLEDILEELVGEIEDEHDRENKPFTLVREGVYEVEASMPIDEANEELGINLPDEEEYDTIAGYVLSSLGRIPNAGEIIRAPDAEIRVKKTSPRRIQTVLILPDPKPDEDE